MGVVAFRIPPIGGWHEAKEVSWVDRSAVRLVRPKATGSTSRLRPRSVSSKRPRAAAAAPRISGKDRRAVSVLVGLHRSLPRSAARTSRACGKALLTPRNRASELVGRENVRLRDNAGSHRPAFGRYDSDVGHPPITAWRGLANCTSTLIRDELELRHRLAELRCSISQTSLLHARHPRREP